MSAEDDIAFIRKNPNWGNDPSTFLDEQQTYWRAQEALAKERNQVLIDASNSSSSSSSGSSGAPLFSGSSGFSSGGYSGGSGGCFTGSTKVLVPKNEVEIRFIEKGDIIKSWDPAVGEFVNRSVQKVIKHTKPAKVIALTYEEAKEPLLVTPNHPLMTSGKYKRAGKFEVGDNLSIVVDGEQVLSPVIEINRNIKPEPVVNLHTGGKECNFAVGADGVYAIANIYIHCVAEQMAAHRVAEFSREALRNIPFGRGLVNLTTD